MDFEGELVVLFIDDSKLKGQLVFEGAQHPPGYLTPTKHDDSAEEFFPHLYGDLNVDAVVDTEKVSHRANEDWKKFSPRN